MIAPFPAPALRRSLWEGGRRVAGIGRSVFETFTGLLYPPSCAVCEAAVGPDQPFCAECSAAAPRLQAPFCAVCSWPFPIPANGGTSTASLSSLSLAMTCGNCRDRSFAFDCAVSALRHDGSVRELIVRFKYRGERYLRRALVHWLADALLDPRIACRPADALVPVPLHPRRRRERGYNQTEECCRLLGRRATLPVWPVLRRARYTGTQTHLSREERAKNLSGAFSLAGGWAAGHWRKQVPGADLLLVDDVFTSGATVDACARVLLAAGAVSVRVVTIARR